MTKKDLKELRNLLENKGIGEKFISKIDRELKPISISSRKAKGRNLQYKVCEMLSKKFNIPYVQSDDDCLIHSREMGQHGTDVVLRGDAGMRFPFAIECKNQESLNLNKAIEQAKENKGNKDWIVIHKKNGTEEFCTLSFKTFLKFFSLPC